MRRLWPHLRLWLIALHVVAIVVMATPNPGPGLNRAAWKNPTVQGEIGAWSTRLNGLGIDVTPKELEAWAWDMAQTITKTRKAAVEPFEPYHRYAGVRQPWNMFVAPHRHPATLAVDILVDGEWTPIYRARSSEHAYRADFFDHDRVRAMLFRYGWPAYRNDYETFARWLCKQVAVDFPNARKARVTLERTRTRTPEEVRAKVEVPVRSGSHFELDLAPFRPDESTP